MVSIALFGDIGRFSRSKLPVLNIWVLGYGIYLVDIVHGKELEPAVLCQASIANLPFL